MLAAPADFFTNMSAQIRAPLQVRIIWDQVAPAAAQTASSVLTDCHTLSRPAQILGQEGALPSYAALERGRWPLDGKTALLPASIPAADRLGIWSTALSDEEGVLSSPAVLTLTFSQNISPVGLTLCFDETGGGYATRYEVEAYKGTTLIQSAQLQNDRLTSIWAQPMDDINKLVLRFTHWSLPGQRVRISSLIFGVIRTFENQDLVEFSCLRQCELTGTTAPASELRFAIDNRDASYDPHNPSGIFAYVEHKQETRAYLGFQGQEELIPLGLYYPVERSVSGGKAVFRCLDMFSLLDTDFPETQYSGQTFTAIAQDALSRAGVLYYSLDTSLQNLTATALVKNKSCRQVLCDLAAAARLWIYTRQNDGYLVIGTLPAQENDYILSYQNSPAPGITVTDKIKTFSVEYTGGISSVTLHPTGRDKKLSGNPFITTKAQADQIITWLTPFIQRTKTLRNQWRQNPALECGDTILVTTRFGDLPATVVSQRWLFTGGGLSGETESLLL